MSRPRHYWYGVARKMAYRYKRLKDYQNAQEFIFYTAIEKALEETKSLSYSTERLWAIEKVVFERKLTVGGAAYQLCFSEYTVQRWVIDFINLVGKNAGFT